MNVSVIIPTYNREEVLLGTLNALLDIDYPAHLWEIIIVDDGSNDGSEVAVRKWIERVEASAKYIKQENAGPAAARNRGATVAQGEVLIFIDNDIIVEPDFIRRHLEALAAHPGCWILGRVTHPAELRGTPFGRYRDTLHESFHKDYEGRHLPEVNGMSTQNVSIPAEDFRRLGGFDESFTIASGEDWELAKRAKQNGIRVLYQPEITVLHNDWAVSLEQFCRRHWLYSFSDVLLFEKYGEDSPRKHLVRENWFINWGQDKPDLILKKGVKSAFATTGGQQILRAACKFIERLAPDSKLSRRFYELAVSVAIFQGVRAGIKHYSGSCS